MKILHIITSLSTGGAERLVVELLPRFIKKGINADLLLFDGTRTPFRNEIEEAGIKVIDFGIGTRLYDPRHILRLRNIMGRYDIVHTHNTAPQYFAAFAKSIGAKTILVTTEHNTSNRRRKFNIFKIIDRLIYNQYKQIICISNKTEENLMKFIGTSKANILTIYNGIDVLKFKNAEASNKLRQDIPIESKIIIMVAAFRWEKDQDTLIRAAKHLPKNYHIFFIGEGPRRTECTQLADSLNVKSRVHFLGLRSDVPNLLKEADALVQSSHVEGFGLAAVEGMAAGKPVFASDIDGLSQVVKGAGILFKEGDEKELATKILTVLSDMQLHQDIIDKQANRAISYDISNMVQQYISIYNNLGS